jgi:hypothetical protein
MFLMAYSLQHQFKYWSGNPPRDREKGRRARGRRPCPATAGSRAGSVLIHSAFVDSSECLVETITHGYEVTVLR